jgi:pyridoxal phosphate enzyme (YggS family)
MDYSYLKDNYVTLLEDIKRCCVNCEKNFDDIKIVAVSKTFPSEIIKEVYNLGHRDFGENRVQELEGKYDELKELDIKWHLVGHLQTNKVKYIIDYVSLIHSVDSVKLAEEIDSRAKAKNKRVDVLVQVNTSDEMQKSGCEVNEAMSLCKSISGFENIVLKGLMTIGKFTDDTEIIRENFRTLKNLYDDIKVDVQSFEYLSMGMTSDYEIAIEEGANMLRIGSAVFGKRS